MNIYLNKNGERQGPFSTEQLANLVSQAQIRMSDEVWYEGCDGCAKISDLPDLANAIIPPLPSKSAISSETKLPDPPVGLKHAESAKLCAIDEIAAKETARSDSSGVEGSAANPSVQVNE